MKSNVKLIHWLPRILCILAILFISIFALDAFEPGQTIWHQLAAFAMHLIPSFILLAFLIMAWKWELTGGIIFTLIGIITSPIIYLHNRDANHFPIINCITVVLFICFPFIIVGVLFIMSYFFKKKQQL
jgi:hypothetical protein